MATTLVRILQRIGAATGLVNSQIGIDDSVDSDTGTKLHHYKDGDGTVHKTANINEPAVFSDVEFTGDLSGDFIDDLLADIAGAANVAHSALPGDNNSDATQQHYDSTPGEGDTALEITYGAASVERGVYDSNVDAIFAWTNPTGLSGSDGWEFVRYGIIDEEYIYVGDSQTVAKLKWADGAAVTEYYYRPSSAYHTLRVRGEQLWGCNSAEGQVWIYDKNDLAGGYIGVANVGNFLYSKGGDFDDEGAYFYVIGKSGTDTKLYKIDTSTFAVTSTTIEGSTQYPTALVVYGSEIICTEDGQDRLVIRDLAGTVSGTYGSTGTGNDEFDNPTQIDLVTYAGTDELWILDENNNRIKRHNVSTRAYIGEIGIPENCRGFSVNSTGTVLFVHIRNGQTSYTFKSVDIGLFIKEESDVLFYDVGKSLMREDAMTAGDYVSISDIATNRDNISTNASNIATHASQHENGSDAINPAKLVGSATTAENGFEIDDGEITGSIDKFNLGEFRDLTVLRTGASAIDSNGGYWGCNTRIGIAIHTTTAYVEKINIDTLESTQFSGIGAVWPIPINKDICMIFRADLIRLVSMYDFTPVTSQSVSFSELPAATLGDDGLVYAVAGNNLYTVDPLDITSYATTTLLGDSITATADVSVDLLNDHLYVTDDKSSGSSEIVVRRYVLSTGAVDATYTLDSLTGFYSVAKRIGYYVYVLHRGGTGAAGNTSMCTILNTDMDTVIRAGVAEVNGQSLCFLCNGTYITKDTSTYKPKVVQLPRITFKQRGFIESTGGDGIHGADNAFDVDGNPIYVTGSEIVQSTWDYYRLGNKRTVSASGSITPIDKGGLIIVDAARTANVTLTCTDQVLRDDGFQFSVLVEYNASYTSTLVNYDGSNDWTCEPGATGAAKAIYRFTIVDGVPVLDGTPVWT